MLAAVIDCVCAIDWIGLFSYIVWVTNCITTLPSTTVAGTGRLQADGQPTARIKMYVVYIQYFLVQFEYR